MAVVQNIATEIGDALLIQTDYPVLGLTALASFTDVVVGETSQRQFKKEFRYSKDGITYSAWQDLTNPNLAAITFTPVDIFIAQYRYSRIGTDNTGEIKFSEISLTGSYIDVVCGTIYSESIFAEFFACSSVEVLGWALNVLEKLYKKGIIPNYIERAKDDGTSDDDFIKFWYTITTFFAYIVIYSRQFKNFDTVSVLLREYLKQKDVYFCEDDESDDDLLYILHHYWDEMRKRGSLNIQKEKGEDGAPVDGELLRLICKGTDDDFVFALTKQEDIGWWLDSASPLYQGVSKYKYLNKAYENTEKITKTNYPLLSAVSVSVITDGGVDVLSIPTASGAHIRGIGADYSSFDFSTFDFDKYAINISTNFNYELSFDIKQPVDLSSVITFGVLGFDKDNNLINFRSLIDRSDENFFFERKSMLLNSTYYHISGYIFNKGEASRSAFDSLLDIGFGQHLISTTGIVKLVPIIVIDTPIGFAANGSIYVKNVKLTHLDTNYSTGFLGAQGLIKAWMKQNNGTYTNQQVEAIIRKKLIPYDTFLVPMWEEEIEEV